MIIRRHSLFRKNFKKRIHPNHTIEQKFEERLNLLLKDPQNPLLKDHLLIGRLREFRAFSITGDIRVVYRIIDNTVVLYDIGSHNQVY